jgi:hypothetical protein
MTWIRCRSTYARSTTAVSTVSPSAAPRALVRTSHRFVAVFHTRSAASRSGSMTPSQRSTGASVRPFTGTSKRW